MDALSVKSTANMDDHYIPDLFEKTPDLVCIVNKEGWLLKVNPAVSNTLGYTEEELLSQPVSRLIHPEDKERTGQVREKLLKEEPLVNFQNRYLTKSGSIVWLEWTSIYIPEKEVVFAIAKNITKKKASELAVEASAIKYKELASHFKNHVEKDRLFFASQLHEELAQLATVIKMDLEWIATQSDTLSDSSSIRVKHGLQTTQTLIDRIRQLSYSINPGQIDEIGLDKMIGSLCQEFISLTKISCSYKSSFNDRAIDREIKLDLFRICQEALLNVMHHAQATEVLITVKQVKNKIELSVKDNGKGFEHESRQSFGLKNMRGRAESIDGELTIESEQSKGTRVQVSVNTRKNGHK